MINGYNKSDIYDNIAWILEARTSPELKGRPCVFISHKYEDKSDCREIANYLSKAGIDYYLDDDDDELQMAVATGDAVKITESIKKGINKSTHMLVVVSSKTYKSQWVPFEVGYGHSSLIDTSADINLYSSKVKLSVLTLKDIAESDLPEFMQVGNIIRGTKSLNTYIADVLNRIEKSIINESRIFSNSQSSHPLDNVLNWQL